MRADLHVHTNFSSDAFSTPEEVVDMAIKKGLSYIAITDHNTTEGAEVAKKYAEGKGIVVLVGEEISCKEGHVLAINIKREIAAGLSVYDAVNMIHKQGGFAIAPHPFRVNDGISMSAFTQDFDAVEGMNGNNLVGNDITSQRYCKKWSVPMVAGSDAHDARDVGNCGIEFSGDIFDCLLQSNFKIYGKRNSIQRVLLNRIKYHLRPMSKIKDKISKRGKDGKTIKSKKRRENRRALKEERFN